MKKASNEIVSGKKLIKKYFKKIEYLIPSSKQLEILKNMYRVFVIFKQTNPKELKLKITQIEKKQEKETRNPYFLNINDRASCVIGIDIISDDYNKIVSKSDNTKMVFEMGSNNQDIYSLKNIMPNIIAQHHNKFIENFKTNQIFKVIHNYINYIALTSHHKAFLMKACIKMLIQENKFFLIAYIKAIDYKSIIVTNKYGEIDSFGENFHDLTKISYKFKKDGLVLNLLLFMPGLIPLFLDNLYGISNFWIDNFSLSWTKNSYLFIFKDHVKIMQHLSLELKKAKLSKFDYCTALYQILSKISYDDILHVYRTELDFSEFIIQQNIVDLSFVELKISNCQDITKDFLFYHFHSQMSFVEKLIMTDEFKILVQLCSEDKTLKISKPGQAKIVQKFLKNEDNTFPSIDQKVKIDLKCNQSDEKTSTEDARLNFEEICKLKQKYNLRKKSLFVQRQPSKLHEKLDQTDETSKKQENSVENVSFDCRWQNLKKRVIYQKLTQIFDKNGFSQVQAFWFTVVRKIFQKHKSEAKDDILAKLR